MFSIIIPTYNSESTIKLAISSILNQTFKDYEIIIVDCLSNDRTMDIVYKYAKVDHRVRYKSQKDNGIYDAMNYGVSISLGDYLYFLGSDDTFYDNRVLQNINDILIKKKFDVIYGSVFRETYDKPYLGKFKITDLYKRNICHQAIFIKKDTFSLVGFFNTNYKVLADWDHNMKWFLDKMILKGFTNIIVANFSEGGYSAVNKDYEFLKNKDTIFLKLLRDNVNPLKYLWLSKTVDTDFSMSRKIKKVISKRTKKLFENF